MSQLGPFAIAIVVMLLVMVIIAMTEIDNEQRRAEGLRQAANNASLDFRGDDEELLSRIDEFKLFSKGESHQLKNLVCFRRSNADVSIFDYKYTVRRNGKPWTYRQSVLCLESDRLKLPSFELRPERWYHKIASLFGYQDINFSGYPKFSRRYLLRGDDERDVQHAFTTESLRILESVSSIYVEGNGDQLIMYCPGVTIRPDQMREFMEFGFEFFCALTRDT